MKNKEKMKIKEKLFMPVRWNTFWRDFIVIQIGYSLFGLSIALLIQANLGADPWAVLSVPLANIIGISIGTVVIYTGFVILAIDLLIREKVGWGTLGNILFIGPWLDYWLRLVPFIENNLFFQFTLLLIATLLMGIATAIYIGVNAGAGPKDSLMLGVSRLSGMSLRMTRALIEIFILIVGWLLGGPIGFGTAIFAILIGPSVQWSFRIFKVKPREVSDE